MLIKSKHPKFSLVLLALLLSCSAIAQVQFPSTNTIYTVEDGREFVQFWEKSVTSYSDSIGNVTDIFSHQNTNITAIADGFSTLNRNGKLITNRKSYWNSHSCFDYSGNIMFLQNSGTYRIKDLKLLVYRPNGTLIKEVEVTGKPWSNSWFYSINIFAKRDGGFYIVELGNMNIDHYEDEDDEIDDILQLKEFDGTGNLIRTIDLRREFQKHGESAQTAVVGKDNCLYFYGRSKSVYKFSPEGLLLYRFENTISKGYGSGKIAIWDKEGNLALGHDNNDQIAIYNAEGKFKHFITFGSDNHEGYSWRSFFALEKEGTILSNSGININRYNKDGKFLESVFSITDSAVPHFNSFKRSSFSPGSAIATGPNGNIYSSSTSDKHIYKFSPDGKLLKVIELESFDGFLHQIAIGPKGIILIVSYNKLHTFDQKGKPLSSKNSPNHSTIAGVEFSNSGSINVVFRHAIGSLNPDLSVKEIYNKFGFRDHKFRAAIDAAFSNDGLIHVLDNNTEIKIFRKDGDFVRKVVLPDSVESLDLDPGEGYIASGKHYDSRGNFLHHYFPSHSYDDITLNPNSRIYAIEKDIGIVTIGNRALTSSRKSTVRISGQVEFNSSRSTCDVFLNGKTPEGKTFHSAASVGYENKNKSSFKFTDIPQGSTYKLWLIHPHSDFWEFSKPLYKGVAGDENINLSIEDGPIPDNYIRIKGVAVNKFGHPIPGVRVSFGKKFTMTGIHGRYTLAVPPNSQGTLKARKDKYEFAKPAIKLKLNTMDRMPVNFFEKK